MTGIIFTGHGSYGSGLLSAVSLLAGESPFYIAVDFSGEDAETYRETLQSAALTLSEMGCEQILILCDLLGGTPFQTAVTQFHHSDSVMMIYGVNLPFAVQLCLSLEESPITPPDLLALVEESKESLGIFSVSDLT